MKKITLMFFMSLVSLMGYAQLPTEGFEGSWPPTGWTINNVAGPAQTWQQANGGAAQPAYQGTKAAFLNRETVAAGELTEDWLFTPVFTVPTNAQLHFFSRLTQNIDQGSTYKVMIGTDAGNLASFTELQSWTELTLNPIQQEYIEKVVDIPAALSGQPRYIAFVMQGNNGDRWLVDNVSVFQQCFTPTTLTANNVTTTAADLGWANPAGSTSWEVAVIEATASFTGTGTVVTTNPYHVTGLNASTSYVFYVRSLCDPTGNNSGWAGPFSFSTTQIPADLNFATDFETASNGFTIVNGSQTNKWVIGTATFNSPTHALYISNDDGVSNNYTNNSTSVVHAYRDINIPAGATQMNLNFDWKNVGENGFDYIRVWNVPTAFTPAAGTQTTANATRVQIGGNFVGSSTWANYTNNIDVSAWAGTTRRFVFEWRNDNIIGSNPAGAIDNVSFSLITCPQPINLTIASPTQNSAILGWTNVGTATQWEVYAVPAGDPAPTAATVGVIVSSNPYTLTGLTPGNNYKFYVRAVCGPADKSFWSGPMSFSTTQIPATLNYSNDFETENGFTLVNGTQPNQWFYGTAVSNSPTHSLYVTNDNGVSNSYSNNIMSVVQAYRDITVPAGTSDINVAFDWRNAGENFFDYIRVFAVPVTYTPTAGTQTFPGGNIQQIGGDFVGNAAWTTYNQIFNASAFAGGTMRLVFEWRNDGIIGSNPAGAIDNVNLTVITCPQPVAVNVTNPTDSAATINWTEPGTATSWEVYVVPATQPAPTATSVGVVTSNNPYTATGLTSGTLYNVYVRAICAANDKSLWSGPVVFNTTICDPITQCDYSFILTDSFGDGWNGNTMSVRQNGIVVGTLALASGTGPVTVTVPLCNGIPFELFWNSGGFWANEVGVAVQNNFGQQIFVQEPGVNQQNTSLFTWTVDCDNPACLPPSGLIVSETGTTTATLEWAGEATGDWQYIILPAGSPEPTDASAWVGTTTNPTEVTGLTAGTNYEYYVRLVCDTATYSDPAGPVTFNTDVCDEADQCNFTFEITNSQGWGGSGNTFTVLQAGVPVGTFGDDFWWGFSMQYTFPLCPDVEIEIIMNSTGWSTDNIGLNVYTPYLEDLFTLEPGTGEFGATIFTGTPSCDPPPCPRPQNLTAEDLTLTTASLGWEEMATATQWEIIILPYGAAEPLPTDTGIVTTDNPYLATGLTAGTPYQFYVRAICGGDDGNSNWAGPRVFTTLIANDDCDGAVVAPVNTGAACVEFVSGTFTGATSSDLIPSCQPWSTPVGDVWYEFTASNTTHSITVDNMVGVNPTFVVYSGECGTLEEVFCSDFNSQGSVSGLVPGQTYYVMLYVTWINDPTAPTSFDLCIATPSVIDLDNTTYTVPELVSEVLVSSLCATVSNVTWSTGGDTNNLTTGIAKFSQGNSNFELEEGVALVSGNAMTAAGPNLATQSTGFWGGDPDLFSYIQGTGIDPFLFSYNDATVLEFDFVPLSGHMKFPFIFASEEYGVFQCSFSDAFAFFLTGPDNVTTNLAVIPDTDIPVSVLTIADSEYNAGCASQNPEWFDTYYGLDGTGEPGASAPINYNGVTHKMFAESDVTVGATYHIKLVIADRNDNALDSAVFIGPFDIGTPDLGMDLTVDANNALCAGSEAVLSTGLDPEEYSFTWYNGDVELAETGPTLTVTEEGTYTVVAHYFSSTCETTDSVVVEFYDPVSVIIADPQDLTNCNTTGYDVFDLSSNTAVVLEGLDPAIFQVTYWATEVEALDGTGTPLTATYTNTVQFLQTVYVRAFNTVTGCYGVKPFDLIVETTPPLFTITEDFSICAGTSGTITVTPGNFDSSEVTYTWSHGGATLPDTTPSITVTDAGDYSVIIDKSGCTATATVTVIVTPIPVADDLADVTVCGEYTLQPLSAGNAYYTETNGGGDLLAAGDVITTSQEIFVFAASGTTPNCTDGTSFNVTIIPLPVVVAQDDVATCDSYELPALTTGTYYTATNGGGTVIAPGTVITTTTTVYVGVTNGACYGEDSFVVTIIPTPVADAQANVTACDSYTLPALAAGSSYYTGANGTGAQLVEGDVLTDSQTLHVYAQSATTPNCTDDEPFTITIVPSPVVTTPGDQTVCDGYVLPALTVGAYYTDINGGGTQLAVGATVAATQTIYVYSATPEGCFDEESFVVTVIPYPLADAPADVVSCDEYVLPALTNGAYFTATGGTGTALAAGSTILDDQTVYVYATNGTCSTENSFDIDIVPTPLLSIEVPITTECDQMDFVLTAVFALDETIYTPDDVTYTWTNLTTGVSAGTGESIIITEAGTYEVTVTPNGGTVCAATAEIVIDNVFCDVQRGISPNADGMNDSFDLSNLDVKKLSIYNRYGQEEYHFNGAYTNQWFGNNDKGEELPTGTYFYMFERTTGESKTGWIYINRQE
jgi:gliding motility-associated-like protein